VLDHGCAFVSKQADRPNCEEGTDLDADRASGRGLIFSGADITIIGTTVRAMHSVDALDVPAVDQWMSLSRRTRTGNHLLAVTSGFAKS